MVSGKDNMIPSKEEGLRLVKSIQNCSVRHFKDNGHTLLMVCFNPVPLHVK